MHNLKMYYLKEIEEATKPSIRLRQTCVHLFCQKASIGKRIMRHKVIAYMAR